MSPPRLAADGVLLAGGASTRMGAPKALLRIPSSEVYLIEDQLARLARAGCARIACVLGADAELVIRAVKRRGACGPESRLGAAQVILCRNESWEQGPFSSLQVGLQALAPSLEGALVLPLDVPGVGREVFTRLLSAAGPLGGSDGAADPMAAVVPTFGGRGGHPIWIAPQTITAILAASPSARLDHLLRERRCARIAVADPRVRGNVNTPGDWERYCATAGGG